MRLGRSLIGAAVVSLCISSLAQAGATVTFTGPVTDIDGRNGAQYTGPGSKDTQVRYRPWTPDDRNLVLENYNIHDVTNQKGIDIGATINSDGSVWTYDNITVKNYNNERDVRTIGGLHIDGLRISGAGNRTAKRTNVYLEDIWVHDGSSLPINIQDGYFGTIHIKDVAVTGNDLNQLQIATIHTGHIDHIIIEDSPGLSVAIMEQYGSVGDVTVINSPGANVSQKYYSSSVAGTPYSGVEPPTGSSSGGISASSPLLGGSTASFTALPEPATATVFVVGGLLCCSRALRKPRKGKEVAA